MNIVKSGSTLFVYDDDISTYLAIPASTYKIRCSQTTGFFLEECDSLVFREKLYGNYQEKADKIFSSFEKMERNMGVIFSGIKGSGKSVMTKVLAKEAIENGYPVLIADNAYSGIEDYISSIKQECVVIFDEFEKIFRQKDDGDFNPQENLLSLFDGIDSGRKLFVITCNESTRLNQHFLNRPGRFHYHFVLGSPDKQEVQDYLEDNLSDDAKKYLPQIVGLSVITGLTYDMLRAIAFELNQGYSLADTFADLNITKDDELRVDIRFEFTDGLIGIVKNYVINLYNRYEGGWMTDFINKAYFTEDPQNCEIYFKFKTSDLQFDFDGYWIDTSNVCLKMHEDWEMTFDTDNDPARYDRIKDWFDSLELKSVEFKKSEPAFGTPGFVNKYVL